MSKAIDPDAVRKKMPPREQVPPDPEYRILLLAPTSQDAKLTAGFFAEAGFIVEVCWDMAQICAKMEDGCGTVVLAEETLGPESLSCFLQALKKQPSWSDIPITIITGRNEANQRRLRQLAASGPASNVALLERPFHPETLLSTMEVAMRARLRQYQVRDLLRSQRASELRLQNILESISDAFVALDKHWRFTYINQSYLALVAPLYHSTRELLGYSVWEKFPDIVGTEVGRFYEQTMATQKAGVRELFYAPINRWLEIRAHPSPAVLSLYLSDITDRKLQEETLRELTARIKAQARIFDTALSHIADFTYTFDRQGCFTYVNKPLLDLWGLTLEEATGKNFHELKYAPELAERLQRQIQEVVNTGKMVQDETSYTSPEGEEGYYEYIFSPVFDAEGNVEVVAGSTRVITGRKKAEEEMRAAKETAEAANRAKDRFLAVLSHELRTPLTPVLMTVASMEVDPSLPAEARENLSMIRRNVELETKLIDDLLDLSRVASGKLVLHLEPVDLNAAVRHVCSICGPQISEKGVHLHSHLAEDAGFVRADPARFRQVLWNLFSNAVKFTPANKNIHVTTARLAGGRVRVEVRDEGIGIPPEIITKIFDAFEQGEEKVTRQFGGLGLGLAICRALVELHHGTIHAESNGPGKGASFCVELPGEMTTHNAGMGAEQQEETASVRTLRLLVVEDHSDTARALARLLQRSGYLVETASSVASAVELARRETFDLVISDLGLPDATGYELMRRLREFSGINGIAMSGYGMDEDLRKSREAGFSEHLVKPVNVTQLQEAIRRVTGQGNE